MTGRWRGTHEGEWRIVGWFGVLLGLEWSSASRWWPLWSCPSMSPGAVTWRRSSGAVMELGDGSLRKKRMRRMRRWRFCWLGFEKNASFFSLGLGLGFGSQKWKLILWFLFGLGFKVMKGFRARNDAAWVSNGCFCFFFFFFG